MTAGSHAWRPLVAAAALALLGAMAAPLWAADDEPREDRIRNTRVQLKQLKHEREQLKTNLERYAGAAQTTLAEIQGLEQLVREFKRRERELQSLRRTILEERKARARRIERLKANSAAAERRIQDNLRNVYRLNKVEEAASLISLAQYRTYFKDLAYLSRLTRLDRNAILHHRELTADLVHAQQEAERALEEQTAVMESLLAEQAQLVESERALRNALKDIRRNQQLSEAYLAELDQSMTGMEATLAKLEADPPVERAVAALPDPATLRGRLPTPVPGTVVAAFGKQDPRYALKKFQRGIVIHVTEAAEVHAVAAGKVVHAGPFRGYQELVVLDHGGGLFTVYGHLERVTLQRNAIVEAGAALGFATYQPIDEGNSVYFEVRVQGTPENPLTWIEPGALSVADSARQE